MKEIKQLWHRWLVVARKLGEFQSRVILTIFYFVFVTPFAFGIKLFFDPLGLKAGKKNSYWIKRKKEKFGLDKGERQF